MSTARVVRFLAGITVTFAIALGLLPAFGLGAASAATATVTITDHLTPDQLRVEPGTVVTFNNADNARHRLRSKSGPSSFSLDLSPGEKGSYTFTKSGTWNYVDDRNSSNASYFGSVTAEPGAGSPGSGGGAPPSSGGGSSPAPAPAPAAPAAPATATVDIVNKTYTPATITVRPGGQVTWTNNDKNHTVTSSPTGLFDSGTFGAGASWTYTFSTPGTYNYFCDLHSSMTGSVVVPAADGSAPPPPPPPADSTGSTGGGGTVGVPSGGSSSSAPVADTSGGGTSARTIAIDAVDYAFAPDAVSATVGDMVVWTNAGKSSHTVTADDGSFSSGKFTAGKTFATVLKVPGTITYRCDYHPEMVGTLAVGAAGVKPPATPAPAAVGVGPAPAKKATSAGEAASGGTPASAAGASPVVSKVDVRDFDFTPAKLTVPAGTQVTWTWVGKAPHTVTGDNFDSGILQAGSTFRKTFKEKGTFAYRCDVHPDMKGVVEVTDAVAGAAQAPASQDGASADTGNAKASSGDAASSSDAGPAGVHHAVEAAVNRATGLPENTPVMLYGLIAGGTILAGTGLLLACARRFMNVVI